jgi:hypothetical protein
VIETWSEQDVEGVDQVEHQRSPVWVGLEQGKQLAPQTSAEGLADVDVLIE